MSDDDIELGPIDYLVVEWPADRQPDGERVPAPRRPGRSGLDPGAQVSSFRAQGDGRERRSASTSATSISSTGTPRSRRSRVRRPVSSAMTTTARQGERSSPGARPRSCWSSTRGQHRSRPRCAAAEHSSSPTAVSRSTPSSPRSTSSRPRTRRSRRRRRDDMPGLIPGSSAHSCDRPERRPRSRIRVSRRQASRWSQQEAALSSSSTSRLRPRRPPGRARTTSSSSSRTGELKASGVLTDAEFERRKPSSWPAERASAPISTTGRGLGRKIDHRPGDPADLSIDERQEEPPDGNGNLHDGLGRADGARARHEPGAVAIGESAAIDAGSMPEGNASSCAAASAARSPQPRPAIGRAVLGRHRPRPS